MNNNLSNNLNNSKTMTTKLPNKALSIFLLVAEAVTVTIPVIILGAKFDFPDILRQPASKAFELFQANQSSVILGYYIFLISSLIYIPLSYSLKETLFKPDLKPLLGLLTGLGITTAIFQAIGFVRWIFVMPFLTERYFIDPQSKNTITLIYDFVNRYGGMSIGEHLGFLAMGSWTLVLSYILICHSGFKKILGYFGIFIGFSLIISVLEHFGGSTAGFFGTLNFLANTIFTFWIVAIAIAIGFSKRSQ